MSERSQWRFVAGADDKAWEGFTHALNVPGGVLYRHVPSTGPELMVFAPHSSRQLERMTTAMFRIEATFDVWPGKAKPEGMTDRQYETICELYEASLHDSADFGEES